MADLTIRFTVFIICWHLLAPADARPFQPIVASIPTIGRRLGLASKSVVIYQSIKIRMKWKLLAVDEYSSRFAEHTQQSRGS